MTRAVSRMLVALVLATIGGAAMAAQAQLQGTLAGKASKEAKEPFGDYAVQVRDVMTCLVLETQTLDVKGKFSFGKLALTKPYLVELFQIKEKRVICTEGPFTLTPTVPEKLDVDVSCGKVPAAFWLLLAGAGAAAAVSVATRSASK